MRFDTTISGLLTGKCGITGSGIIVQYEMSISGPVYKYDMTISKLLCKYDMTCSGLLCNVPWLFQSC